MAEIKILIEPYSAAYLTFHAFNKTGRKVGAAILYVLYRGRLAQLHEVRTEAFGGKGSGAAQELIKARVAHAFENNPGCRHVEVMLPHDLGQKEQKEKLLRVKRRYGAFGFRTAGAVNIMKLTRSNYERLKPSGIYEHELIAEQPMPRKP